MEILKVRCASKSYCVDVAIECETEASFPQSCATLFFPSRLTFCRFADGMSVFFVANVVSYGFHPRDSVADGGIVYYETKTNLFLLAALQPLHLQFYYFFVLV